MNSGELDPKDAEQLARLDREARARVDDLKRRAATLEGEIEGHIEAAEREARARAATIIADAEREAEEIRAQTKTAVNQARERVNELMRLRQALFATLRDTLSSFEGAVARAEEERTFAEETIEAQVAQTHSDAQGEAVKPAEPVEPTETMAAAEPNPKPEPRPAAGLKLQPEAEPAETAIGPVVEVQAEPLKDFAAVSALERALGELPTTHSVHVRAFDDGVAVLDAFGVNVNTLLSSMRASFAVPFILRSADAGKLVIQVGEPAMRGGD